MDEKPRIYNEEIARHRKTTAERLAFVKRRDDAQAKLDALEKPIQEIDKRLEAFRGIGKLPAMGQYWIQNLKNSWEAETADTCQDSQRAPNKVVYSAPGEHLDP